MPRRLAITGPHRVEVIEYEEAPLLPGQVRVRTELASGKHGTTTAMFDNVNFRGRRFDQRTRLFLPDEGDAEAAPGPRNTGTTGVGTVIEVGPDVSHPRSGDRVFGLMDVRETNACPQDRLWPLDGLDPLLALCLEPAYVAFHCLRESGVRYGDRVAIVGLGAIGLLALRLAEAAGVERLLAIDPLPSRRHWAAEHGADAVLDPAAGDAALEVHRLTGDVGVDVAIETSGAYAGLQTAVRCARVGGTICSAGFYQGECRGLWLGREWHHNRLTMVVPHGCGWGHTPRDYPAWDEGRAYDCLVSQMRRGKLTAPGLIRPVVDLDEGPEVFRLVEEAPDEVLKFAVRF